MIFTKNKPKYIFLTIFAPLAMSLAVHKLLQAWKGDTRIKKAIE